MAGFLGFLKAIFIPAIIALVLYVLLSYLILPFIRRSRQRYSQYLPVGGRLETISEGTTSLRHRINDGLISLFVPSRWRWNRRSVVDGSGNPRTSEDELFDDEEGEGMIGFDIDDRRRGALERRRSNIGEEDRRLSRDLEEGFRDDSDEEEEDEPRQGR